VAQSLRRKAVLLTAALSFTLVACGKPKTQVPTPLSVQTTSVAQATFAPLIESISQLESTANVAVTPQIEGSVVKVLVKEGQAVKAGQVILVLDNVQQSAALDSARSEAMKDKVNAERYEYLYSQGAVSAKDRDTYVTEAIQSRDEARADAANLGYKFVRAPIDGVIGDLDEVKLGDYVKAGQTITGIVDNSTLWTLMEIPASQASQVQKGQTVNVESQTQPPVKGQGTAVTTQRPTP
jgi:membrane fusion protein (multidrug efflux system)